MSSSFENNPGQDMDGKVGEVFTGAVQETSVAPVLSATGMSFEASTTNECEPEGYEPGTTIPGFTLEESVALRGVKAQASLETPYGISVRRLQFVRGLVEKGVIGEF